MSALNSIFAALDETEVSKDFAKMVEDPKGFDCSFTAQRQETGFANFGFPADKAAEMREKELARIAAELEAEPLDYEDEDDDDWELDEPEVDSEGWTGQEDNEDYDTDLLEFDDDEDDEELDN